MKERNPSTEPFLRTASGLVRTARPADVLIYNLGLISVGIALTLAQSLGIPYYPGASPVLACVIAGLLMAFIAIGFWFWTSAIPRSGGIYAFVTRGASPAAGFALSFVDSFTWLFYNSLAATLVASIGVAPLLFATSRITGSTALLAAAESLAAPTAKFIVGLVALSAGTLILLTGMRTFFRFQRVLFAVALTGTLAALAGLLFTDHTQFTLAYDAFAGQNGLPSYAVIAAESPQLGFSLRASASLAMWPFLSFVGSVFSIAIGGEVEGVRRSQGIGMFGSITFAVLLLALLLHYSNVAFGASFLSGIWTNQQTNSMSVGLYLPVLLSIGSSPWLGVAAAVALMAWAFFWIPATFVYSGRVLLAWSLDRVAPPALGFVHDRLHTPVTAILLVFGVNVGMLALFVFTTFFSTLVLVLAAMLAWLPTMAFGAVFPWTRKTLYGQVDIPKVRIVGIPVMVIACAFSFSCTAFVTYMLWNDPVAAGHGAKSLLTIASLFAIGLGWYFVVRVRRKRRGFDMEAPFREIPVE